MTLSLHITPMETGDAKMTTADDEKQSKRRLSKVILVILESPRRHGSGTLDVIMTEN